MRKGYTGIVAVAVFVAIAMWQPGYGASPATNGDLILAQSDMDNGDSAISLEQTESNEFQLQSGAPMISIPDTLFDFGEVPQGLKVSHKFIVKNIGDTPLKLIKAKGS